MFIHVIFLRERIKFVQLQRGFVNGLSLVTAVKEKRHIYIVILDVSITFNKVSHDCIKKKKKQPTLFRCINSMNLVTTLTATNSTKK